MPDSLDVGTFSYKILGAKIKTSNLHRLPLILMPASACVLAIQAASAFKLFQVSPICDVLVWASGIPFDARAFGTEAPLDVPGLPQIA
jgi:hypothetical protein